DEYTEAETLDGHDTVEWLAAQPWCTGAIGMWGLSYGGFTSIQVAATRPPHLRAIVPVQATDDRYTDDVHYMAGAALCVGRRVARPLARASRGDAGVAVRVGSGAARRPLLAGRFARARPWPDRGGHPPDRRLDGRVRRRRPANPGEVHERGGPAHDRWAVGPRPCPQRLSGPEHRLAARDRALVRPLAEGHRQRGRGRATADLVPPRPDAARAVPEAAQRSLAGDTRVAAGGRPAIPLSGAWLTVRTQGRTRC